MLEDASGNLCLMVLPSDLPASRQDALDVERFLREMLGQDAESAMELAHQWWATRLTDKCSDSLAMLAEAARARTSQGWHFRNLGRNLTSKLQAPFHALSCSLLGGAC